MLALLYKKSGGKVIFFEVQNLKIQASFPFFSKYETDCYSGI